MSVVIKSDEKTDWKLSDSVEGEGHDHCPGCDSDVEASDRFGGEHGTPLMWEQYVHDRKGDGTACGAVWTRTTGSGLDRNMRNNQQTKWLTTSAAKGRVYSLPSRQFENNYERAFGHK